MQRLSNPPYQVENLKYLIISKNVLDSQESALRKYTSYSISATLLVGDLVGGHYFHSYCYFAHNEGLMEIRNSKQGCLDFQPDRPPSLSLSPAITLDRWGGWMATVGWDQ